MQSAASKMILPLRIQSSQIPFTRRIGMRTYIWVLLIAGCVLGRATVSYADETPTFGTFALFELESDWTRKSPDEKRKGLEEASAVFTAYKERVTVDGYWTYGLTSDSHFMLRLHASELQANQQLLTDLRSTGLGQYLELEFSMSGVTKGLNYAPDFPDLLVQLKKAKYEGPPPKYAIMIPTRKDAAWWNLSKEERTTMMREHTVPTLPYLKTVKRKLYHSTGLADADFITIFETNSLVEFNNLMIALRMVREDTHNVRLGSPTVLGTIKSWQEIQGLLEK